MQPSSGLKNNLIDANPRLEKIISDLTFKYFPCSNFSQKPAVLFI